MQDCDKPAYQIEKRNFTVAHRRRIPSDAAQAKEKSGFSAWAEACRLRRRKTVTSP